MTGCDELLNLRILGVRRAELTTGPTRFKLTTKQQTVPCIHDYWRSVAISLVIRTRDSRFVIGDEMSYLPGYDSVAMALFSRHHDPVDAILAHHGLQGPWQQLPATGIANRIYATDDLVLRIAVEGQEALDDARTESVAAPVAGAAGVCVPRLVAFDDSGP